MRGACEYCIITTTQKAKDKQTNFRISSSTRTSLGFHTHDNALRHLSVSIPLFGMISRLKRKKSLSPETDDGPRKNQVLSARGSLSPSVSTSSFDASIALANLERPSGSSSLLPPYGTTSIRKPSSLTMRPRTSAQSISNVFTSGINRVVHGSMKRQTNLNDHPSLQAATAVESPFSSDACYGHTSHASPQPLRRVYLRVPNGPANSRVQGDATQHFQPDLENDSTATPPPLPSQQGDMTYPLLLQAQYSNVTSGYDPITSERTNIGSSQPPTSVSDYRSAPCLLCNAPQDDGAFVGPIYETSDDFVVHLWEAHMGASEWLERECLFAVCSSHGKGVNFATVKLWLAHVRNVHHKSYYCHRPDCKYRFNGPTPKAFGSQTVLDRHGLSKSHAQPIFCDKPGCTGKDNLARKDKRNKHQVEYHGQFLCSAPNCPRGQHLNGVYYGFGTAADLLAHEHEKHARRGYDRTTA